MKKRQLEILNAGLDLWSRGIEPTPSAVADRIGMTHAGIHYYYNSTYKLKEALASYAVETGCSRVILQLIAQHHHAVTQMGELERLAHLRSI